MGKYIAESKYVCSIYPGKLPVISRPFGPDPKAEGKGGRNTNYWFPPISGSKTKGENRPKLANVSYGVLLNTAYAVMEVSDAFQNTLDAIRTAERGKSTWTVSPVSCEEIVADILKHWCGNMIDVPPDSGPGIMEIANATPTQADLEEMKRRQTAYYEHLFQEGEKRHAANDWKGILETMRDAAKWLNRERIWSTPGLAGATVNDTFKDCPACFTKIHPEASICAHCGTRLKALPKDITALNVPVEQAVA